jgi:integrase
MNLLTARQVAGNLLPGRYSDGGNLYLVVTPTRAKSWRFIFRFGGKQREMGLGSVDKVPLKSAREEAEEARKLLGKGTDPIVERKRLQDQAQEAAKRSKEEAAREAAKDTFGAYAIKLLKGYEVTDERGKIRRVPGITDGHRNAKHRAQWESTLREYAAPLWAMKLDEIKTEDVLRCITPIWTTKAETAARVRSRIERVLSAAIAARLREGPNPALLRGHLELLLPKRQRLQRGHHAAMAYGDLPGFWQRLSALDSVSAQALAFTILTAARSGETRGATWAEFDLEAAIWVVPPERMKAGREHRVPLSDAALAILEKMGELRPDEAPERLVFPGGRADRPLSDMALSMCLRGLADGMTVHGFRSSFRDWSAEETPHARVVAEQALAHVVGNATERAYRRGDALAKRRALMVDWANFVISAPDISNVLRLGERASA